MSKFIYKYCALTPMMDAGESISVPHVHSKNVKGGVRSARKNELPK